MKINLSSSSNSSVHISCTNEKLHKEDEQQIYINKTIHSKRLKSLESFGCK